MPSLETPVQPQPPAKNSSVATNVVVTPPWLSSMVDMVDTQQAAAAPLAKAAAAPLAAAAEAAAAAAAAAATLVWPKSQPQQWQQ